MLLKNRKLDLSKILIIGFLSWFIISLLVFPNFNILGRVFIVDGAFDFSSINRLMNSSRAMNSLKNSFILAFTLLVTTNIVGISTVLFVDYFELKGRKFLSLVYKTPLIFGGIMVVSGYRLAYGNNGVITRFIMSIFPNLNPNWFTGYLAVVFIMTFMCTSNYILFLSKAVRNIDNQNIEAARSMGASPWTIFTRIVIPGIKPTLFAISSLLFLTGLSATAAPLLVGGTSFQTINPMIITFSKTMQSRDLAALLSLILGISTLIILLVFNRNESKTLYSSGAKVTQKLQRVKIDNKGLSIVLHCVAYFFAIIYLLPLVLSIVFSFMDGSAIALGKISFDAFTISNYIRVLTDVTAAKPFLISFIYSITSAIIAVLIVVLAVRYVMKNKGIFSNIVENSFLIPMLLPTTLIALGLMLTYDVKQPILFNQILIGTPYILVVAYVIVMLPFTLRMVKSSFFGIDKSLEEASKSLGASSRYSFIKVILPIVLPTILSVIALNFNGRLSDFDITVLLYHPLLKPLGIMMRSAIESEKASLDERALVYVYSVLLMIISAITIKLTSKKGEE